MTRYRLTCDAGFPLVARSSDSHDHRSLGLQNGPMYFDGHYHLFMQYNPESYKWGDMHWYHLVSTGTNLKRLNQVFS